MCTKTLLFPPQIPHKDTGVVSLFGEGAQRESGALCSLFAFPLELTPSFRASTRAARITEFNELNRELRGLIQHHLQGCLDGGRYYY